jgi:hypothetical protein
MLRERIDPRACVAEVKSPLQFGWLIHVDTRPWLGWRADRSTSGHRDADLSVNTGDVDFLLRLLKENPVGIEQWERCRPMVGSISPAYVEAVNTGLNLK